MYGDRGFSGRGGGGYSNDRQMTPPVREGDEIDVTIEAVGEKGDGIAKQKGFVLFVPNTKAGERVRIKITRVLAKVGFAQVLGPAQTQASDEQRPQKKAEPEFEPKEELDTEDFGDDSGGDDASDDMADDSDDDMDDAEDEQK
jgi:predicted RNA-binding protein with TRAM domain